MKLTISRLILLGALSAPVSHAYSILAHEAIIDSVWDTSLKKALLKRFPRSTPAQLEEAHAYVYGGCIIQDMGYYPFSNRFFSDLTHYVRTGDFIVALIKDSQNLNEYAFALGALAHDAADSDGHRYATNVAVPILYPKLGRKFGPHVTYWDNPISHARTEFGFDVLQVAKGRYAPDSYKAFIGFQVSKPVLERAFLDTYGIELKDVFSNLDLAIGSYRYTISSILPEMTRVAWNLKKDEISQGSPGATQQKFLFNVSRASYEKDFGTMYQKPGVGTRLLTWVIRVVPKVGPLAALSFKPPTPETEKMFMASFNTTIDNYKSLLAKVDTGRPELINENFDTGEPTELGKYLGADEAYAKLLEKLDAQQFSGVKPDLRANILAFYKNTSPPAPKSDRAKGKSNKKEQAELAKLTDQLEHLRGVPTNSP